MSRKAMAEIVDGNVELTSLVSLKLCLGLGLVWLGLGDYEPYLILNSRLS